MKEGPSSEPVSACGVPAPSGCDAGHCGDRTKALNQAESGENHCQSVFPNCAISNALGRCPRVRGHSAGPEALCLLERPHCDPTPAPTASWNKRPLCGPCRPAPLALGWQRGFCPCGVGAGRRPPPPPIRASVSSGSRTWRKPDFPRSGSSTEGQMPWGRTRRGQVGRLASREGGQHGTLRATLP